MLAMNHNVWISQWQSLGENSSGLSHKLFRAEEWIGVSAAALCAGSYRNRVPYSQGQPNKKAAGAVDPSPDPEAQMQDAEPEDPEAKRREYENTLRSNLSQEMYSKKVLF